MWVEQNILFCESGMRRRLGRWELRLGYLERGTKKHKVRKEPKRRGKKEEVGETKEEEEGQIENE